MEEMLKLSLFCIIASMLVALVGQSSQIMGILLAVTAGLVFLGRITAEMQNILARLQSLLDAAGIGHGLLEPIIKVLGIALCGRLAASLCQDIGSRWASGSVEVLAVLSSLVCMLPLLERVLDLIGSI